MRLGCFPNAGSGVATFASWTRRAPAGLGLALAHLPGRDMRRAEPTCMEVHEAAAGVVDELLQLDGIPSVLFGHSMGALLAFEAARLLQAAGRPPAALVVSARRGPRLNERLPPISTLPVDEFLDTVQSRYGGIPDVVRKDAELRDLLVPTLRGDMAMIERYTYRPGDLLSLPVHAYGGVDDPHATREELEAWRDETSRPGQVRQFSGGHFYFQASPAAADELMGTLLADVGVPGMTAGALSPARDAARP